MEKLKYDDLVILDEKNEILIGLDRAFSRKFYTRLSLSEIKQKTGESVLPEKIIVMLIFIITFLALITSAILSVFAFKWWSILVIPAAIMLWGYVLSLSSLGKSTMIPLNILILVLVLINILTDYFDFQTWLIIYLYAGSMWSGRLQYKISAIFLRSFIINNKRAYEWLQNEVMIKQTS